MSTPKVKLKVISSRQIRAARVLMGWEQADLAREAGVSKSSIQRAESGSDSRASTIAAIEKAFDRVGVRFIGEDEFGGLGVRLARRAPL